MTGIDGYDWGSVGWSNPIPGDPDVVRQIGYQLQDLASETTQQSQLLQSVNTESSSVWSGPAADAFRPTISKLPPELVKLTASYNDAGDALNGYWPKHRAAQQLAVQALAKAQAAKQAISAAQQQVASAQSQSSTAATAYNTAATPPPPGTPKPTPTQAATQAAQVQSLSNQYRASQAQVGSAQNALTDAQGLMKSAEAMRQQAIQDWQNAAGSAASLLKAASQAGIHNVHHGFFSSIVHDVSSGVSDLVHGGENFVKAEVSVAVDGWHEFTHLAKDALPVLKVIDTVLSDASLVVGILAIVVAPIPGLDAVLDPALEGLNEVLMVAKTGDDLLELAGGDEDAVDELEGDAIGMATMGLGGGVESDAEDEVSSVESDAAGSSGAGDSAATGDSDTGAGDSAATGGSETDDGGSAAGGEPTGTAGSSDDDPEGADAAAVGGQSGGASPAEEDVPTSSSSGSQETDPEGDEAPSETGPTTTSSEGDTSPETSPSSEAPPSSETSTSSEDPSETSPSSDAPPSSESAPPASETAPSGEAPASSEAPSSGGAPSSEASPSGDTAPSDTPTTGHEPSSDAPPAGHGPSSDAPPTGHETSPDAPPASHEPSSDAPPATHEPSSDAPPAAHEPAGDHAVAGQHGATPNHRYSTLEKVLGKDKLDKMSDVSGMKQGIRTARIAVKDAGSDLPKSYVRWTKSAYEHEVGSVAGEGGGAASTGLQTVRKVLYVRERVETVNHTGNLIDEETTGRGNPLERQDDGRTLEGQAWSRLTGLDEPPKWVDPLEELLGVGG